LTKNGLKEYEYIDIINMNIFQIDKRIKDIRLCIICDCTLKCDSTRNHVKSKSHNIQLLLDQFSDSFDRSSAERFIETHSTFCNMDEINKILFIRKVLNQSA